MAARACPYAVMEAFRSMDNDGNGFISLEELTTVLTKLGMQTSEARRCFKAADADDDGQVDYEEFVTWVFGAGGKTVAQKLGFPGNDHDKAGFAKVGQEALACLEGGDVAQARAAGRPPPTCLDCLNAVAILLGEELSLDPPGTPFRCNILEDDNLRGRLQSFDVGTVTPEMLAKLQTYTSAEPFTPEKMQPWYLCEQLTIWVLAIEGQTGGGSGAGSGAGSGCPAPAAKAPAKPKASEPMKFNVKVGKNSILELKSLAKPPGGVEDVVKAVSILLGDNCKNWKACVKMMSHARFIPRLSSIDVSGVSPAQVAAVKKLTESPEFTREVVSRKSLAAAELCEWVLEVQAAIP